MSNKKRTNNTFLRTYFGSYSRHFQLIRRGGVTADC